MLAPARGRRQPPERPDSYWHLVVGDWILASTASRTPTRSPFTFAGKPWIAKEWLSQILYLGAWRLAGWTGMVVLAAAAIALAFGLLTRFLQERLAPLAVARLSSPSPSCWSRRTPSRARMCWPCR